MPTPRDTSEPFAPLGGRGASPAGPAWLTPERAVFVLVSFEGPDAYAQAGGLAIRVTELACTLADLGYETHLVFLGDPALPADERQGRLVLHRWGQWLSAYYPRDVYDGEEDKRRELVSSLPPFVVEGIARPALAEGRTPVVLTEEWQTAELACGLSDELHRAGLRERSILFWNANNPYSFDRIDWPRLAYTSRITAVSRFMHTIIRAQGADALVIPNGIPSRLLERVPPAAVAGLREASAGVPLMFKMARFTPEKGWAQALDAVAELRTRGRRLALVARAGGPIGTVTALRSEAERRGLRVLELGDPPRFQRELEAALRGGAQVVELAFGVTERFARTLYAGCDAVLANSIAEPFGLVGLEAMAAGGVVFTGGTGEDYAVSGRNAVVLDSIEPREIADRWDELTAQPERVRRIRRAARHTAHLYTWDRVVQQLIQRIEEQGARQGLFEPDEGGPGGGASAGTRRSVECRRGDESAS